MRLARPLRAPPVLSGLVAGTCVPAHALRPRTADEHHERWHPIHAHRRPPTSCAPPIGQPRGRPDRDDSARAALDAAGRQGAGPERPPLHPPAPHRPIRADAQEPSRSGRAWACEPAVGGKALDEARIGGTDAGALDGGATGYAGHSAATGQRVAPSLAPAWYDLAKGRGRLCGLERVGQEPTAEVTDEEAATIRATARNNSSEGAAA